MRKNSFGIFNAIYQIIEKIYAQFNHVFNMKALDALL
jgi:hypothetical protein